MKVRVRNASFAGVYPYDTKELPQVAFAGRSNVGKSSLINALVNRKNLVHTSKTPGKTRSVNLYLVDLVEMPPLYLVDLPGYGYARAPRCVSAAWPDMIASYLRDNRRLKLMILLMDIRRDPGEHERMLLDFMAGLCAPVTIAATKADKLGFAQRQHRARTISDLCGTPVVVTSSIARIGLEELWDAVGRALGTT